MSSIFTRNYNFLYFFTLYLFLQKEVAFFVIKRFKFPLGTSVKNKERKNARCRAKIIITKDFFEIVENIPEIY